MCSCGHGKNRGLPSLRILPILGAQIITFASRVHVSSKMGSQDTELGREKDTVFGLGATELLLILAIVVIVFGVGKLPELGTGLGEGIKNFKKSYRDAKAIDVTPPKDGPDSSKE